LQTLGNDHSGVISTQVMQEFFVVGTKKLAADPLLVKDILHSFENIDCLSLYKDFKLEFQLCKP